MKRIYSNLFFTLIASLGLLGTALPVSASATPIPGQYILAAQCGNVTTSIDYGCGSSAGGPIYGFLRGIIKFASGLVGLVVILMMIIGGIRYITSAGDPKQVAAAKTQITNAVIGLVLFGLMLAILNFLLPGGIIK